MFVSTFKTAITNLHNLNYPDHDLIIINIKWNQKRIGDVMVSMLDACDNVCQVTFKTNVIVFIVYIMCLIISHCPMI
jgi:hypothetical protein